MLNPHEITEIMKYANPLNPSCILIPAHRNDEPSNEEHTIPQQRKAVFNQP
jgi:hypothetical protein